MFNTLFKVSIDAIRGHFSRVFLGDDLSGRALRTAAVLALVAAPLFAPPSANAMNNWETALMGNYSGSNLTNLCGNCHAGFSGREIGNPNRADYWIWTAKGGTPATNSPYYTNDHDMDGFTTGQEYTNSQAGTRPAITVDWIPGYPDKDNDGCIQIYNRLGEVGMPNNVRDIISDGAIGGKGFANYVPWGWDQDDNDATQGCNLTWPTTPDVAPSGFTTPVTTSDDGNPPSELPAAITDFRASGRIAAAIPLVWTAVGDDGMTGNAHSYDLRYTTQAKALAALQCGVGDAEGTSACNVRDRGHWSRMYDLIGGTVDGSGCSVLTKTAGVTINCVGTNAEWNTGPIASPLMRAFYEPVPTAPGSAQGCSTAPGQSATCTLTTAPAPSYVLKAQGVANPSQTPVPINTITDGTLYWLATRVSDGVLQISGTLEAPTGFTENVSLSNIVAITAGTTGTAITAITGGASISGTSGTISITGLGLTASSAARLALVRADGSTAHFVVSPTIVGGTSASASFTGLAAGTYTLETQTSAGATTAAWVDAVTVTGVPPVFSSINPNQGGQGATSRLLTLGGSDLAGGTLSFSGTGIASVPVSGSGPFTASINIDAGASATVRDATVTTASGSSTLPSSFTVTAAPIFSCTPAISLTGTVGVAYPTSVCTASGGSPAGTSYTWTPAAVPTSLSAVVSGANSEILTISGTPTAAGTFATTIRLSDGNGGTSIVPYTIVIAKGTPTITWANPAAITYGTALSGTQLNATASVPGAFVYTPAAGAVLNAGTQTLSTAFTPTDTANYNNASATATLVVNKVTPTITWANPVAITYGTALSGTQLNATASVPGAFVYTPAAGAVLNAGTQTLSAAFTPTDTVNYNNASATATLVVNKATPTITWANPAAITYGTALSGTQLNATSVPGTFVYTPAAGAVLNAGTQTLSTAFTPTDTVNYNNASATATLVVNKATPTITWANPAAITYGTALSGTQLNATASVPGAFVYTPAAGAVLTAGTQTLSTAFTPTDTANYNNASATATLVVNMADQTIGAITFTPSGQIAINGGTTQASATASSGLAVTFGGLPANDGICTVSSAGVVTGGATSGNCTVVASQAGDSNYNAASSVQQVVVVFDNTKKTPTITWATPAAITYGTPLSSTQLNATATDPVTLAVVAGSFVYTPAAGAVLNAGSQSLSVVFNPTDTVAYNTASGTNTLQVNKADQTIGTITFTPATLVAGGTTTASATATSGLSVTAFMSMTPATCTVAGTVVTGVSKGICTVGADQAGDDNYNPAPHKTQDITVTRNVDMVMATVTKSAAFVGIGQTFAITNVARNQGTTPANATTVSFYLSADAAITTADIKLTGVRSVPGLAAMTSSTSEATVVTVPYTVSALLPSTVSTKVYYVGACADIPNVQPEETLAGATLEGNNCKAATGTTTPTTIIVRRNVDLVMTGISKSPATVVGHGKTLTISSTVKNQGTTPMTVASAVVRFYLSADATITTADTPVLGSRSFARLNPGQSNTATTSIVISSAIAPKKYYLGACADATNLQIEATLTGTSLETNNCKAATGMIEIVRNVDLTMSAVSSPDDTVIEGTDFIIDNSVKNVGTAAMLTTSTTTTRFYLSIDATITAADILLTGTRTVTGLAAGATSSALTVVTLPFTVEPGVYYVGAIADGASQLLESVETNNSNSSSPTPTTDMITVIFDPNP